MLAILLKWSLRSVFSEHISLNKQYVIVLVISLYLCELQEYTNGLYRLTFMDVWVDVWWFTLATTTALFFFTDYTFYGVFF